jgi:hypothetical protein
MSHRHERCIRIYLVLDGWGSRAAGAEVSTASVEDSKAQHGQKVYMDLGMYGRIMIMMVIVIVTVILTLEHISFMQSPAPLELSVFLASAYYLQSIHALVFPLLMWVFFSKFPFQIHLVNAVTQVSFVSNSHSIGFPNVHSQPSETMRMGMYEKI